jgi:hypothetical protein
MELLSRIEQKITIVETRVQHGDEVYFVKDYLDERGKVIDTTVQTKGGYIVDDPAEVEEVLDFIDSLEA